MTSAIVRRLTLLCGALLVALVGAFGLHSPVARAAPPGQLPVTMSIDKIDVEAPVEVRATVDNTMQDPTGPEVVSWYDDSAKPGAPGNAVFAGHLNLGGYGPAVFADLSELREGDVITVTGKRGKTFRYAVAWVRTYDAAAGPWVDLTGPTQRQTLTLITCAPPWNPDIGHYQNRLVVRAVRIPDDAAAPTAEPTPSEATT